MRVGSRLCNGPTQIPGLHEVCPVAEPGCPTPCKQRAPRWCVSGRSGHPSAYPRACVRRQSIVDAGHGHFGVTLLRPAFEELVWIEFLSKNVEVARALIPELSRLDAATAIRAQMKYAGVKSLQILGFDKRVVECLLVVEPKVKERIKAALLKLGWKTKDDRKLLPSMSFLTKKVGRADEYGYIYHGTSRFVHFSTHELLRRVWGKHGEVTVSSKKFSLFWSRFALYWGYWTLFFTLMACSDLVPDDDSEAGKNLVIYQERFLDIMRSLERVPIVTMEELRAWDVPSDG